MQEHIPWIQHSLKLLQENVVLSNREGDEGGIRSYASARLQEDIAVLRSALAIGPTRLHQQGAITRSYAELVLRAAVVLSGRLPSPIEFDSNAQLWEPNGNQMGTKWEPNGNQMGTN